MAELVYALESESSIARYVSSSLIGCTIIYKMSPKILSKSDKMKRDFFMKYKEKTLILMFPNS